MTVVPSDDKITNSDLMLRLLSCPAKLIELTAFVYGMGEEFDNCKGEDSTVDIEPDWRGLKGLPSCVIGDDGEKYCPVSINVSRHIAKPGSFQTYQ